MVNTLNTSDTFIMKSFFRENLKHVKYVKHVNTFFSGSPTLLAISIKNRGYF